MPNYSRDMRAAPPDEFLLLLVPTGDPIQPVAIEIGFWDEEEKRFLGNWRWYDDEEGSYPNSDPIAWRDIPDIDPDIVAGPARSATVQTSGAPMKFFEVPAAA